MTTVKKRLSDYPEIECKRCGENTRLPLGDLCRKCVNELNEQARIRGGV